MAVRTNTHTRHSKVANGVSKEKFCSVTLDVMFFSFQLLMKNRLLGQLQIHVCRMSEMNKGPKYIILIVFTMILVMSGYQYILNVTIRSSATSFMMSSDLSEYYNVTPAPCQAVPGGLHGKVTVEDVVVRLPELERKNMNVLSGGEWRPESCQSQHNVAIVIPFRNRMAQLLVFLNHMHSFLQRQELHYRIYVITQVLRRCITFSIGNICARRTV